MYTFIKDCDIFLQYYSVLLSAICLYLLPVFIFKKKNFSLYLLLPVFTIHTLTFYWLMMVISLLIWVVYQLSYVESLQIKPLSTYQVSSPKLGRQEIEVFALCYMSRIDE